MRSISKSVLLIANRATIHNSISARSLTKALNQEQVSPNLNPETLISRLLLYLREDKELHSPKNAPETLNKLKHTLNSLHKLPTSEIIKISGTLTEHESTNERIFKELDVECYLRLPELSNADIFRILNGYINAIPNRIVEMKFYNKAVKTLYQQVHRLPKKELIQLMFYIGLSKKSQESQLRLRHCMRVMDNKLVDDLTTEELCIICNATFKTSTKIINPALLKKVRDYVNTDLTVMKDCAWFITLIKTLRHNRCQSDDLLNTISYTMFFNKTFTLYTFPVICHVMALFADYFYYEQPLFKLFTEQCLDELKASQFVKTKIHPRDQVRGKDITRFLWVLGMFSELKLVDQNDINTVIIPKIMQRVEGGEFDRDFNSLVNMTLYLWMLNCRNNDLVPYVLNKTRTQRLAANSKSNLRLNLLLYAIYLEEPDLLKQAKLKPTFVPSNEISRYQLKSRPLLERLLVKLKRMKEIEVNRFELTQEISHLNIIGITGYKNDKKAIYVEVLDDYTRLRNVEEDIPVGLMALKLRLLDCFEEAVLTVSTREVEEMTDSELTEYLRDEMRLVC